MIYINVRPKHEPAWFCSDCEMEGEHADVVFNVVGALLARWDEFHPAIEWLARDLGLPFVMRRSKPEGKSKDVLTSYRLASGEHLDPLPTGDVFSSIECRQADPQAVTEEEDK